MANAQNVVRRTSADNSMIPPGADGTARQAGFRQGQRALSQVQNAGPVHSARPGLLPSHIPITRDGIPDLTAMSDMGLAGEVGECERRARFVSLLKARQAERRDGALRFTAAEAVRVTALEAGVSTRTLHRWARNAADFGAAGLVPLYGKTRGTCRSIPQELQRFILDAYAYQGCLTFSQVYEQVVAPYFREHGDGKLPHLTTIRRFVHKSCPEIVRSLSRDGRRSFEEEHVVRVLRDMESAGVNGWWVSDHRLADTFVLVPDGKGAGWPAGVRKMFCTCGSGLAREKCCSVRRGWWTCTIDIASAAFVGWRISLQPNAATVCHTLHQAIMGFGLPGHWLRDNGLEFCARRLGGKALRGTAADPAPADLADQDRWPAEPTGAVGSSSVWEMLGVQLHTAIPYSAWSKYVESLFGAWSRRDENRLPGYVGKSAKRRPQMLEEELARGALLTVDQYVEALGKQIAAWNEGHKVGKRRKPPLAYYADYVPRRPDPQTLTFLLQAQRTQTIRHGRLVLTEGGREHLYISEELALYSGVQVSVRLDPGAPDVVWVYTPDGRCIAVKESPLAQYGEWGETNLAAKQASRAQRQFIREWAAPIKGTCPVAYLDPTGAHRAVEARLADAASGVKQQQLALKAAEEEREEAEKPEPRRRSIYTQIEKDLNRAWGLRPAVRDLLELAFWERAQVRALQPGDARMAPAVDVWLRCVLEQSAGRRAVRAADVDVLGELEDVLPGEEKLSDAARAAAVRSGSTAAVSVGHLVGRLFNLGCADLAKVGWKEGAAAVLREGDQLAAGWERDRLAGAYEDDLRALSRLGLVELAGLKLPQVLEGAAGREVRGVVGSEWEGGPGVQVESDRQIA